MTNFTASCDFVSFRKVHPIFQKDPTLESLLQLNGFLAKATWLLLQCSNLSESTAAHRSGKNQDSEVNPYRCQSAHFSLLTGRSQASLCFSKLVVILSSAFCTYPSYGACNKPSSPFSPMCLYLHFLLSDKFPLPPHSPFPLMPALPPSSVKPHQAL